MPETNNTRSVSETQCSETQSINEEPNESSDVFSSVSKTESITLDSDESSDRYPLIASECYPYNNGMDSPEEVIEAYLDAVIRFVGNNPLATYEKKWYNTNV